MITINCATKLKALDGSETPMTVGAFLAEIMWSSRENHSRSGMLAGKFYNDKTVELKAEDVVFIKKIMTTIGARAGEVSQVLALLGEIEK